MGQAFSFDGVDDYAAVASPVYSPSGGTVALWFLPRDAQRASSEYDYSTWQNITGSFNGTRAPGFYIAAGNLHWEFANLYYQPPIGPVESNRWYHVAMTYDSDFNVRVYLNGALVVQTQALNEGRFADTFVLGAHWIGHPEEYFDGFVDEVKVYKRPLAAEEIRLLAPNVETQGGTGVITQVGQTLLTFPKVDTGGLTTVTSNPEAAANYSLSDNLGSYEITTTAVYNTSPPDTPGYYGDSALCVALYGIPGHEKFGIKVAFTVQGVNDPAVFNNLLIGHGEDTDNDSATPLVLVPYDQSYGSARHTYKDFATRTVWVYVPHLSPFVILKGAGDQIANLTRLVYSFNLRQGINNSLDAKLQNAVKAYQAVSVKDRATACNIMSSFVSEVQSQAGKSITTEQAQQLTLSARQVRTVLGCR